MLLLLVCSVVSKAQWPPTGEIFNEKKISALRNTKLYANLGEDTTTIVAKALREGIQRYWDFNKYEFTNDETAWELRDDEDKCFMSFVTGMLTTYEGTFIQLVPGDNKKRDYPPSFERVLIDWNRMHDGLEAKMFTYVKQMSSFIKDSEQGINKAMNTKKIIEEKNHIVKQKKLLVLAEDLNPEINSLPKLKQRYHGKFEIVNRQQLNNAIRNDEDVLFIDFIQSKDDKYGFITIYSVKT
jgi:hypothetical protein